MAYAHESEISDRSSEGVRDISLILYSENRSAMAVTRNCAQAGVSGLRPEEFHGSSLGKKRMRGGAARKISSGSSKFKLDRN